MKSMRSTLLIVVILAALLCAAGCTSTPAAPSPTPAATTTTAPVTELTVYAAASLKDAFTECGRLFEANHTSTKVVLNFDGSQALRTQLQQGASADIFASANTKQMNLSKGDGRIENDTVTIFVHNRIAILVPAANPAKIAEFRDLADPDVKLVIGTPDVPVGDYARQLLNRSVNDSAYGPDFRAKVLANVVSEETNVNSLATKIVLGEADAGIAYASDVPAAQLDKVTVIELPAGYQVVADYPIAVVKETKDRATAQAFIDFVLSDVGQDTLARFGFTPV